MNFDKDLVSKLELDKIIELAQSFCFGEQARLSLQKLTFLTDKTEIDLVLSELIEYSDSIDIGETIPLSHYENTLEDLYFLQKENYVLSLESIVRIRKILLIINELTEYFKKREDEEYPLLKAKISTVDLPDLCIDTVDKILDERGEVKPNASPEIVRIGKNIQRKEREIEKRFREFIKTYVSKKWLSDSPESIRSGRRVLSVPAEHKRKVKGIIHDESATGKTVFIEPDDIVQLNNELFELENEKRREIQRLILEICQVWRPFANDFLYSQKLIVQFDVIQAKARFGQQYQGRKPKLKDSPCFEIWNGKHPLLLLSQRQKKITTVPFDFTLHPPNRLVIISGPNAGGKTVLMKSIGLFQMMLQAGYLLPCDDHSQMGIVSSIFTDIGDQQSIEDDLSTYSSRLKNMNEILENADKNSLILIDEFGSGTDPNVGGAIAESILKELNRISCWGVITTHYSNLKTYAFRTKGMVNASMLFDKRALKPTFQIKLGSPGSSFAFEIAAKSGLSKQIIEYAKKKTGKQEYATDEILSELQDQKRRLDQKIDKIDLKESKLQKLITNYEQLQQQLNYQRKKHKLLVKERDLQEKSEAAKELNNVIRAIREDQKLVSAKKLVEKLKKEKVLVTKEIGAIKQDLFYKDTELSKPLEPGDFVKLRSGSLIGKILRIEKKRVEIMMGAIRMEVNLTELVPANEPLEVNAGKSIQTQLNTTQKLKESELDIRGYRVEEANQSIEEFIDKAIVADLSILRLVHGKGNGVLRKFVKQKLRGYREIQEYYHPENEQGGDGVTIIKL
jgi:DNA mismatch repair protein MutS2